MKKIGFITALLLLATTAMAGTIPSGTLTFTITPKITENTETVTVWIPYPMSDAFQTIDKMDVSGNYSESAVYRDPASEAVYLYANWQKPAKAPTCVMRFHIAQRDRRNTAITDNGGAFPELVQEYLKPTAFVPADAPEMKAIAEKVTQGKTGTLEKAKAVYDWVVENTFRDPAVKGCGLGQPLRTLNQCQGGGKCADLSTVFVTLARAAGIPARDVYGLRLATPKNGDVTSGFHCWAEFYLPGTGWVMVDPADVRKMMLVHKLELKDAGDWRKFFWGGDDLFRLLLEKNARGAELIGAPEKINYFMYPAAQVDGKMLNYFDPANFSYKVEFELDK
ncbi:Transglutaminase domain-containing protein [Desulfosarcina cetonica]|nr:Transglutaminase domain-containing protein [Desulfosarcina cetonica]